MDSPAQTDTWVWRTINVRERVHVWRARKPCRCSKRTCECMHVYVGNGDNNRVGCRMEDEGMEAWDEEGHALHECTLTGFPAEWMDSLTPGWRRVCLMPYTRPSSSKLHTRWIN